LDNVVSKETGASSRPLGDFRFCGNFLELVWELFFE
jgi:hypothetical protein